MPRSSEITFYDELGVDRGATPEQIRDAFRAIVKIVHPDHQTDEQLKEIADGQMRKLNRIYAVLSDPEKRRRYNEDLDDSGAGTTIILSPQTTINVQRLMGRLAWVGALAATLVAMVWLASESPAAHVTADPERPPSRIYGAGSANSASPGANPASMPGITFDEVYRLRTELRNLKAERDLALREVARLKGTAVKYPPERMPVEPAPLSSPALPTTMTELPIPAAALPSAPPLPAATRSIAPARATTTQARSFGGFWFYSGSSQFGAAKTSTLYPPEFIELTIVEQGTTIRGRYRSRYKIADRAISPDVNFEFSGTINGTTVVCPWVGGGGSKGELTLKLAGEHSMKVDWTAAELGSTLGLVNGTATLTRRIE